MLKSEKKNRYYYVIDDQGEAVSFHRSLEAAEAAIWEHEQADLDYDQGVHEYRVRAPRGMG